MSKSPVNRPNLTIVEPSPSTDDEVQVFVSAVGEKIRSFRRDRSLSQKSLSELSGISQRYLAQMESGAGNISLAMLFRLGQALKIEPGALLASHEFTDSQTIRFANLFAKASPQQQAAALSALGATGAAQQKSRRICLIGLRGAGKSTLGRLLADDLNTDFTELNTVIEDQSGMPVSEVMALYGQEGYRQLERSALQTVAYAHREIVLAVGGGIVTEEENYQFLLNNFHTIWLKASPGEHMERVRKQGDSRPMAGNPRAMEELQSILVGRETLYQRADAFVDTSSESVETSAKHTKAAAANLLAGTIS